MILFDFKEKIESLLAQGITHFCTFFSWSFHMPLLMVGGHEISSWIDLGIKLGTTTLSAISLCIFYFINYEKANKGLDLFKINVRRKISKSFKLIGKIFK